MLSPVLDAQNPSFLTPLQERDSVLVADQLRYGVELSGIEEGTVLNFPDWSSTFTEGVSVISPWQIDTVRTVKPKKGMSKTYDIRGSVIVTSFDEGRYELPRAMVERILPDGLRDTVVFDRQTLDVRTMPVDTATFKVHPLKGQIRYPVTFREILPWLGLALAAAGLIVLAVFLIRRFVRKSGKSGAEKEPAHIAALRKLDAYRGEKLWAADKQKLFYSGVTDALREYIAERFGVSAMEMTTKEIFDSLSGREIPAGLYEELNALFVRADYVKFAKYVATTEENAASVPLAVRFVTTTYQSEIDAEQHEADAAATK